MIEDEETPIFTLGKTLTQYAANDGPYKDKMTKEHSHLRVYICLVKYEGKH